MAADGLPYLWIIGPGRVGLALGLALHRTGALAGLTYTGLRSTPPDHPLFHGSSPAADYQTSLHAPSAADAVLVAVPDSRVAAVGAELTRARLAASVPVVHTSGALGAEALGALRIAGHAVGSMHPLAAVADPVEGPARLAGAWFAVDGDPEAVRLAESLVAALGGQTLRVAPGAKPLYHAAAVAASNYVVTLLGLAERWMVEAGVDGGAARAALATLAHGAVAGVESMGPLQALTGPIARGDVDTVLSHLSRLSPPDRALYCVLARGTLEAARLRGLDPEAVARLARALEEPQ